MYFIYEGKAKLIVPFIPEFNISNSSDTFVIILRAPGLVCRNSHQPKTEVSF